MKFQVGDRVRFGKVERYDGEGWFKSGHTVSEIRTFMTFGGWIENG